MIYNKALFVIDLLKQIGCVYDTWLLLLLLSEYFSVVSFPLRRLKAKFPVLLSAPRSYVDSSREEIVKGIVT